MVKKIGVILFTVILTICTVFPAYAEENVYFTIAELYMNKQYEECIEVCESTLEDNAEYMEAYYFKSFSEFSLGNYDKAYETLKEQLAKNSNNRLAIYNAACAASVLEKDDESADLLERLLALDITEKSAIKADSDFDNVRDNEKYKRLMEISVVVGGELVEFDVPPVIIDNRTLVPVRKIFECLGASVTFDEATQTATAEKEGIKIEITIGSKIAKVNGEERELDVPAMTLNYRTLVPVRFVSEALNAEVEWDNDNEVVNIIMPMPDGSKNYDSVKESLDKNSVVSVVDGIYPEPYMLKTTEGMTLIILKDEDTFKEFSELNLSDKKKYMSETVYDNFALVVGCEPVYARVVYDGRMYYEGEYIYNKGISELSYYSNGKLINVVKQYTSDMNYKDFYLLPEAEQTTSEIND